MVYQNTGKIARNFDSLSIKKYDTRVYKYKEIQVEGYTDLLCKIKAVLKVVSKAVTNDLDKEDISLEISNTLDLLYELIPIAEGDILDNLHNKAIVKEDIKSN